MTSTVQEFVRSRATFEAIYLRTYRSDLVGEKVERALRSLECCRICPRNCDVNRLLDEVGTCASGRYADVGSSFHHFGEEDVLRGWKGSGTIFFSHCNLKCVFCQNFDISRKGHGSMTTPDRLADMMLQLQRGGCHNINFVTPEHVVPQIVEALHIAIKRGLHIPLVYNTSAYDSIESLELMEGLVDIYMPDFKYWRAENARKYLKADDYPEVAKNTIREMHRQVGPLVVDENGIALRGLIIRHLVMPGALDDTRQIFQWIANELGRDTYINIMDQFYPAGIVSDTRYPELNRRITSDEYTTAMQFARELGLWRIDERWR